MRRAVVGVVAVGVAKEALFRIRWTSSRKFFFERVSKVVPSETSSVTGWRSLCFPVWLPRLLALM